jgi:tetratricopeptide (TPR) repeat protein
MNRKTSLVALGITAGVAVLAISAFGFAQTSPDAGEDTVAPPDTTLVTPSDAAPLGAPRGADLDEVINGLQLRLEAVPEDHGSWATLGLAYVQQARITVNPEFYARADGALAESLAVGSTDNFLAYAGMSALASARHDFAAARDFAEKGLEINDFSALLYGALSDAQLQLGDYDGAFASVDRMLELSPGTDSNARASYTWELRGNLELATKYMQDALDGAPTAADRSFALFQLGELAFNAGDANAALELYNRAIAESSDSPAPLAGKAKAEAALGQVETALEHYGELVNRAPEPSYLVEYGELLESLGRTDDAREQYDTFIATQQLFEANGVEPDSGPVLFYAQHGDPARALRDAEVGIRSRPFIAMYDAYAWALHVNGRHAEALDAIESALQLGTPNAQFYFHSGMIKQALGDDVGALADLRTAVDINAYFDPLDAPAAIAAIEKLSEVAP